jgi:hypothetical protein
MLLFRGHFFAEAAAQWAWSERWACCARPDPGAAPMARITARIAALANVLKGFSHDAGTVTEGGSAARDGRRRCENLFTACCVAQW